MKHLNNKGYMLVEIILASVLAMVIAYFMTDLTIKLKNKNDDLLVKTLASTDQAIIYNTIMKKIYTNPEEFDCNKLYYDNNKFEYDGFVNIMSKYVSLNGTVVCSDYKNHKANPIIIKIPLEVSQLPDDNFEVNISYSINS